MALVLDEKLVEKIVGEVMFRLRPASQPVRAEENRRAGGVSSPVISTQIHAPPTGGLTPPARLSHGATFAITDRVVTAELLSSRLNGQKWAKVAICPKAVITPSAFDYLRTHKIVWHRNTAEVAPNPNKPMARWKALIVTATPSVLQAVEHAESQTFGKQWSHELLGSADEAINSATSAINRGEVSGITVFADHAELIVCRANRSERVNAAVVSDVQLIPALKQYMNLNLMVVRPSGRSFFELRNLLKEFGKS
ncbi:hypothetical protein LBMAG52_26520 [Planctomycetia bacterium]|nr:hypothetical protein LBMAG52_26520 [Planctomycetia bacterium]